MFGKIKVSAHEIIPADNLLAMTVSLVEADAVLGEAERAVQDRTGSGRITEPCLRKQIGQQSVGIPIVGIKLDGLLKTMARLGFLGGIANQMGIGAQQVI